MRKRSVIMIGAVAALALCAGLFFSCSKKEVATPKAAGVAPPPGPIKLNTEDMKKMREAAKAEVAAKVNGTPISMDTLLMLMNRLGPQYVQKGQRPTPEIEETVRKEALNRLIFVELAIQQAKKDGITVKPGAIDEEVRKAKERLGGEAAFKEFLASQSLSEAEYRQQIERNMKFGMVMAKEVDQRIQDPDEESIKAFYEKEKARFVMPEHIIVKEVHFAGGNGQAAKKKAEEVLALLKKNGGSFEALGKDPGFIVRELGVTRDFEPSGLYAEADKMRQGEVSGIIALGDGLHIIMVEGKKATHQMTFQEARNFAREAIIKDREEKRRTEWERQLRSHAKIEVLGKGEKIRPAY